MRAKEALAAMKAARKNAGKREAEYDRKASDGEIRFIGYKGLSIPVRIDPKSKKMCCDMTPRELDVALFEGLEDKLRVHLNDILLTLDVMKSRFCGKDT